MQASGDPPGTDLAANVAEYRRSVRPKGKAASEEGWTDYTRYALGVDEYIPQKDREGPNQGQRRYFEFMDRRRTLGVDFGPQFTGLALSLGGVNTIPLGTVKTGQDWKNTAIKIAQTASTRRVKDIVIGQPLEKDGTEGKIGRLVRHFGNLLADASLLLLGPNTTVFLWDERFSTTYAAMRLVVRPNFDGAAFKSWLDGQRGLDFGRKALLDAESARAILEHFLAKDPRTEEVNKERAERVPPSAEACRAYLRWRRRPMLQPRRPSEPAGPGREGWEWSDFHAAETGEPPAYKVRTEDIDSYMQGMNNWGDRRSELEERLKRERAENAVENRIQELQDETPMREAMRAATKGFDGGKNYKPLTFKADQWKFAKKKKKEATQPS